MLLKQKPLRDSAYLQSYKDASCIVCGAADGTVVGAHIRHGSAAGMGMKPPDNKTLPLCYKCHTLQHKIGEVEFWEKAFSNEWLRMDALKALAKERYALWKRKQSI